MMDVVVVVVGGAQRGFLEGVIIGLLPKDGDRLGLSQCWGRMSNYTGVLWTRRGFDGNYSEPEFALGLTYPSAFFLLRGGTHSPQ